MLENYHIILASNSPRRRELLGGLDIDFEVKVLSDIEESYPGDLPVSEVASYIAGEKADAYKELLELTCDIIIQSDGVIAEKETEELEKIKTAIFDL